MHSVMPVSYTHLDVYKRQDKTGTLTENRMTVQEIATPKYHLYLEVSKGKEIGFFSENGENAADLDDIRQLTEIAVLCNNTQLPQEKEEKGLFRTSKVEAVQGDPTESALLVMAESAHFSTVKIMREFSRTFEIPFDSQRKRMSVIVRNRQGDRWIFSKGAPDYMLELCSYYLENGQVKLLTPSIRLSLIHICYSAGRGKRNLLFCPFPDQGKK